MYSQPPLKLEQINELRSSESGWGSSWTSARRWLGWVARWWWWCAQTVRLAPACLLLAAGGKEVRTCPGCAHLDWPENAGSTGSPNLFLWLTFNSHNAFRFSRASLHRALKVLTIHI